MEDGAAAEVPKEPAAPAEPPEHATWGIKQLKEELTELGMGFAGATEKEDLVRLLTKAKAQALNNSIVFSAGPDWSKVPKGVALPPGLEVRFDLAKGCNYARLPAPDPKKLPETIDATEEL